MITDVAIPGDTRVCDKELEKIKKYSLLKDEIAQLWQMKKVVSYCKVIPTVVGTLGTITTKFEKYNESLGRYPGKDIAVRPLTSDVCSHSKNQRYQNLSSVRDNIKHNNDNNNNNIITAEFTHISQAGQVLNLIRNWPNS